MTVIREITTDQFLSSLQKFDYVSFQQTPFWAEARRVDWPEFSSVGWYADGPDPISVAIIRYRRIPGTTKRFAFIPYGPLIDWDNADIGEQLAALRTYLEAQNVIGVRMLPYISLHRWDNATVRAGLREPTARHFRDLAPDRTNPTALRLKAIMRDSGWIEKSVPQETRIDYGLFNFRLDLEDRTEDDVLAGMHKTWRYNAKKASREGVEIDLATISEVGDFQRLFTSTGDRNGFPTLSTDFFRTMWTHLGRGLPGRFTTHFARLEGELLGATTTVRVSSTAECIHTATDTSKPRVKPSNALYLATIRQLLSEGAKTYDLGGVKDCLDLETSASGLVRFKTEMGADAHEYMGAWELPVAPRAYAAATRAMPIYAAAKSRVRALKRSAAGLRSRAPAAGRPRTPAAAGRRPD
jgi:lipid II:glycine glycyltransferase (peptidoglycan interpeptide bridge formation enzyme)